MALVDPCLIEVVRDKQDTRGRESDDDDNGDDGGRSAEERRRRFPKASVFDLKSIQKSFKRNNVKLDHAFKLWRFIVQRDCTNFDEIPSLPKRAISMLNRDYSLPTSKIVGRQESSDSSTTKLLIELQDGRRIESVIMRYGHVELSTYPDNLQSSSQFRCSPRSTVCVSSQVGCAMGCRFCATGTMGLLANLTSGEILEQLYHASRIEPIRNVVFMGMGEPLDNYSEVMDAIKLMSDVRVFNLASHRISLSTVGVVPRIRQLARDAPDVSLALSLHAPNQEIRERIVPTAKGWHIDDILKSAIDFVKLQRERSERQRKHQNVLIEYVLIQDINSDLSVAHQLGQFLLPHASFVVLNVIPYNPTLSDASMERPSDAEIDAFIATVRSYGVKVLIRQTLGQDISSACGQLVAVNNSTESPTVHDVEDILQHSCSSTKTPSTTPQTVYSPFNCIRRCVQEVTLAECVLTTSALLGLCLIAYKSFHRWR